MKDGIKRTTEGVPLNRRKGLDSPFCGEGHLGSLGFFPRITYRKERRLSARSTRVARYRVRCGCCEQTFDIEPDGHGLTLDIDGVTAAIADWKEVLLPLLGFKRDEDGKWYDPRG